MSTPIETENLIAKFAALRAERDRLKAQRDGLLVALKNAEAALWAINGDHSEAQSADYHAKAARAAIAEAEKP